MVTMNNDDNNNNDDDTDGYYSSPWWLNTYFIGYLIPIKKENCVQIRYYHGVFEEKGGRMPRPFINQTIFINSSWHNKSSWGLLITKFSNPDSINV